MMSSRRTAALLLALTFFTATSAHAARPLLRPHTLHPSVFDYDRRLDVNRLILWVNNDGSLAFDANGGGPGLLFPRSGGQSVIFASGLWLGGVHASVDTLISASEYSSDFQPGNLLSSGLYGDPDAPGFAVYKVVRYTGDPLDSAHVDRSLSELASNPSLDPLAHHSWSEYMSGAAPFGAPWKIYRLPDTSTPEPLDSVDVPGPDVSGDQMLWALFNDGDPIRHTTFGFNAVPIGVEVRLTVFGYANDDSLANTAFVRCELFKKGSQTLDNAFVALWSDSDIGDFGNDLVGCDTLSDLGYSYNGPSKDAIFGSAAPAVGYDFFLAGPRPLGGPRLFSFNQFTNGTDPVDLGSAYRALSGYQTNGDPIVDPTTASPTRYFHPGDPVAGTGWIDTPELVDFMFAAYEDLDPTHSPGLEGLAFGGRAFDGGADVGWNFQEINAHRVSSIDPLTQPEVFPPSGLLLEFGGTQKAYRYLRRETVGGAPPAVGRGYTYGGFRDVSFQARDPIANKVYDVAFVERVVTDDAGNPLPNGQQPATFDSTWSPDTTATGGFEYVLVLDRKYTGLPDPAFANDTVFADTTRSARPPVLFALWARQPNGSALRDPNDAFGFFYFPFFSDRRMLLSSGPFTFAEGDTQSFLAGITVGQGDSHLASITDLRARDAYAQKFVDDGKVFLPAPAPVRDTLFTDRTDFGTNSAPTGAAAGDLDHDGKLDLVVISGFVDSLWVYYGKGDGSFDPPVGLQAGPNVRDVAIGELDGNLFPEIVTSNDANNTVTVLEGSAARFTAASVVDGATPPSPLRTDFGTAAGPGEIAIGNLIGDPAPEVAVVCGLAESLVVLRGTAGGLTPDRTDFGTGSAGTDVAIGDVNGDLLPDVVLTRKSANAISLFRGIGGDLDPNRADFGTGSAPVAVAVGDLNGDQKDDVAVTLLTASAVAIHLGTAGGLSPDRADFGTGSAPVDVALVDLNGDGKLDVATSDYDDNTITVLHGLGNGTLGARTEYPTGVAPAGLVFGDFNGDGGPDLLTVNVGSSSATLYENKDQIVSTLVTLASADVRDGRVHLSWYAPHGGSTFANVYRSEPGTAWTRVGGVLADGYGRMEFTDADVQPGGRYGYRLGIAEGSAETYTGEVWVSVTSDLVLALAPGSNPTHGAPALAFTLPRPGSARLELYDVRGRRLWGREVGGLGPGSHVLQVGDRALGSGVYWARLVAGPESVLARFVHLR